jgi:hypothetical protein
LNLFEFIICIQRKENQQMTYRNLIYIISSILDEYYNKRIHPFIIRSNNYDSNEIFRNNSKFYKDLFINNMKISIMHHLQIDNMIFDCKIDKISIKKLTLLFCNKFEEKVKQNTRNDINIKFNGLNHDIITCYLISEINFCLSRDFSFYHYIK